MSKRDIVVIGAGGHAKVVADIILAQGDNLVGFLDDSDEKQGVEVFRGHKVIGRISDVNKYDNHCYFIVAIGDNYMRENVAKKLKVRFCTAIHPRAIVADTVKVGKGTVIMAGAIINPDSKIGDHCIINTAATVDHDNIIGNYVHISPGAHLAGSVTICEGTWVCTGVIVVNNIFVGRRNVIGAGATVITDILEEGYVYVGSPSRRIKKVRIGEL